MKKLFILLLLFSTSILSESREIEFKYTHSLRIPYHYIVITFGENMDSCIVHVTAKPLNNDKRWASTIKDYIKNISKNQFDSLFNRLCNMDMNKFIKSFNDNSSGKDGTDFSIRFGNRLNCIQLTVWTPELDTKERGLEIFWDISKDILNISELKIDSKL